LATGLVALDVLRIAYEPDRISFRAGGTAGNVAAILGALGWSSFVAGPEDESVAYELLLDDLRRCGVGYRRLHRAAVPVIVEELGNCSAHRFSFDCPTCGRALPRYHRSGEIVKTRVAEWGVRGGVFFADRLSDEILALARVARRNEAFIVYEPSDRADAPWATEMFSLVDMIKYSGERAADLPWLTDQGDYLEVQTLGAQGLQWRWASRSVAQWQSMCAVDASSVVDTCGAGDWLTSGILMGLLEGAWLRAEWNRISVVEQILQRAQQLAAWSCGYAGARGALYESGPSVARAVMQRTHGWVAPDPLPEPTQSAINCVACPA
jgi:fructokinase